MMLVWFWNMTPSPPPDADQQKQNLGEVQESFSEATHPTPPTQSCDSQLFTPIGYVCLDVTNVSGSS